MKRVLFGILDGCWIGLHKWNGGKKCVNCGQTKK